MKQFRPFLPILSLCIAWPSLAAQNTPTALSVNVQSGQPTPPSDVPDYNALPPGLDLLKNAIKNPDGSLTIKAGHQTPEANQFNQRYCESLGGVDATNETDQTIGVGTLYAVVCKGPATPYPAPTTPVSPNVSRSPFGAK